jgi:hypothetical protein
MVGNFPESPTKSSAASGARAATYTSAVTFGPTGSRLCNVTDASGTALYIQKVI